MGVLVERCCGLDIHKTSVVACLLVVAYHRQTSPGGRRSPEIREMAVFETR
jgi:hypothetical protein